RNSTSSSPLAGSSLEATSQSSTESASEVSLSGQSAVSAARSVTSAPASAFGQQPLDERPVHRRAPVVRADDPLDDRSVAVEQEALRNSGGLIGLLDLGGSVVQHVKRQVQLLREVPDIRRVALVDAHRGDLEPLRAKGVVQLL